MLGLSGNIVTVVLMAGLLASLHWVLVLLALSAAGFSLVLERRVTSRLYEYFYKDKPLVLETPTSTKVLCYAEIMPTFLSTFFSRGPVFQLRAKRRGRVVSQITTQRVVLSGSLLANIVTGMPTPS